MAFLSSLLQVGILFYIWFAIGLFCHEAGHALAAGLIGYRPRIMRVGRGSVLFRQKIGLMWVVIHAVPVYGWVIALGKGRSRILDAIYIAAGPLANIALFFLCIHVLNSSEDYAPVFIPAVIAQIFLALGSIYPNRLQIEGRLMSSDGLSLLRLLSPRQAVYGGDVADLVSPFVAEGVSASKLFAHIAEIEYQSRQSKLLGQQWASDDAVKVLRDFPMLQQLPEPEQAFVLSMISFYQLAFGRAAFDRANVEEASTWAVALHPTSQSKIIRGGVLVEVGCPEMALDLLLPLANTSLAPTYRVLCRAFIGQAKIALGDKGVGLTWFEEARSFPEAKSGYLSTLLTNMAQIAIQRAIVHAVMDVYVQGLPTRPAV